MWFKTNLTLSKTHVSQMGQDYEFILINIYKPWYLELGGCDESGIKIVVQIVKRESFSYNYSKT